MTRRLSIVALIVLAFALVAPAAAATEQQRNTHTPWIPKRVERAIEKTYPSLAYAPAWLPSNYHFAGYLPARRTFQLAYSDNSRIDALTWSVLRPSKASCDKPGIRYRLNGVTAKWEGTYPDQDAWRCIKRGTMRIMFDAATGVPGNDKLNTPRRRHAALVLAKAVAYAEPLR